MLTIELAARRRTIKAIVISILALACATLVAVHLWTSWQARSLQLSNTRISSANTARALADQASSAFKMVDTVLVAMLDRIEADGLGPARKEALRSQMARHLAELPALQGLFVYDEAGRWIVNSAGSVYEGRSNADRDYYRFHRSHPGQGVHIGAPILGRTSGAWVIPVSRRLEHADGRFAGVLLATIKVDFFRAVYERIDVRRDGEIVLALQDGTRLLGIPFAQNEVGQDIAAAPLFARLAGSTLDGGAYDVSAAGVNRMVYFGRAGDYPVLVAFARSADEALEGWRNNTIFVSCALLLLVAGLGVLGAYLARQMRARDGVEHELLATKAALEASNATLASQANVDPLTGLFNKRYYERALQHELACARRERAPLAALMIDVDHFKKYNDRYGHMAGDACLVEVAQAIRSNTARPRDVAARFGGEEFVVLLPCTDEAGALVVAEGIRAGLEGQAIAHEDARCGRVTVSIGVWALEPGRARLDDDAARMLMERADAALYLAKSGGRNRVTVAIDAVESNGSSFMGGSSFGREPVSSRCEN